MVYYSNTIYIVASAFSMVLMMIPLPWHLQAYNVGTVLFMFWTWLGLFFNFINAIIWNSNAIDQAPWLCDITAKVVLGVAVGIPAASLVINRRLYYISAVNSVRVSGAEKRRAVMVDLAIGLGIPILQMIVCYVPQGQRYIILERIGCAPAIHITWVAFVLIFSWPVVIGLISACYCIASIRGFYTRQQQFKELLSAHSNLNANRYIRLMCLASIEVLFTVPLGSYYMYQDTRFGVSPWISWAVTHFDFQRVDRFPAFIWTMDPVQVIASECTRWSLPFCAIVFFAFFGFADEAQRHYRFAYVSVARKIGYTSAGLSSGGITSSTGKNGTTLPVFIRQTVTRKRDSLLSFEYDDDKMSFTGSRTLSVPELFPKDKDFSPLSSTASSSTNGNRFSLQIDYSHSPRPESGVLPSIARPVAALNLAAFERLDADMARRMPVQALPRDMDEDVLASLPRMSRPKSIA